MVHTAIQAGAIVGELTLESGELVGADVTGTVGDLVETGKAVVGDLVAVETGEAVVGDVVIAATGLDVVGELVTGEGVTGNAAVGLDVPPPTGDGVPSSPEGEHARNTRYGKRLVVERSVSELIVKYRSGNVGLPAVGVPQNPPLICDSL